MNTYRNKKTTWTVDALRNYLKPEVKPKPSRKKKKVLHSKNKGISVTKTRRKMAAASNRINRKRCRNWKH